MKTVFKFTFYLSLLSLLSACGGLLGVPIVPII